MKREKEKKMYMVYWTEETRPQQKLFASNEMVTALKLMEDLRALQRTTGAVGFITMSSEIPECVTMLGVDSVVDGRLPDGKEYTWKKRRI